MNAGERPTTKVKCEMKNRRLGFSIFYFTLFIPILAGCQQKMAEQPYYKPYEPTDFFTDGRSNRPLEAGVVHRGQNLDADPLVTGLTPEEWRRFWRRNEVKVDPAAAQVRARQIDELGLAAPARPAFAICVLHCSKTSRSIITIASTTRRPPRTASRCSPLPARVPARGIPG